MKRAGSRKAATRSGLFLTGIRRVAAAREPAQFPFTLPLFRDLERLDFRAPVTFLVGRTAAASPPSWKASPRARERSRWGAVTSSATPRWRERARSPAGSASLRARHPRATLFLRAEDVFGFTLRVGGEMAGLRAMEDELRASRPEGSWGQRLAVGAAAKERAALTRRYGAEPDARSHGESFLHLLQQRLVPRGLYFLDEPETPLSPTRVLALLAILRDRVAEDCQFVVATHSPILMALPQADIRLLEDGAIAPVAYADVEHVRITRAFLDDPESFLRRL